MALVFHGFPQSFQGNVRIVPAVRPQPFYSIPSFPIYSSLRSSYSTQYSLELLAASLNKLQINKSVQCLSSLPRNSLISNFSLQNSVYISFLSALFIYVAQCIHLINLSHELFL
jgi:hypothetical protein